MEGDAGVGRAGRGGGHARRRQGRGAGRSQPPVTLRYYQSPSAFRRSGALTPSGLTFDYRLSPFMGCEKCDPEKNPYCFEHYTPWWNRGEIRVKTTTLALLRRVLDSGEGTAVSGDEAPQRDRRQRGGYARRAERGRREGRVDRHPLSSSVTSTTNHPPP